MNKYKIIAIGVTIGLLLLIVMPKHADKPLNIVVNDNNGDVAICYYDTSILPVYKVVVYNKDGEKLYSKSYNVTKSGGDLIFSGEDLCVAVGNPREKYCYDRNGKEIENDVSIKEITRKYSYQGWEHTLGKFTYTFGEYVYCCETPMIFKDRCIVTITYNEKETVIYESPN